MKPPILFCLAVAFACEANAQFTILPQIGFENTRTAVTVNKGTSVAPLGGKLSPQAAVRFGYSFKKLHGPFIGLATSHSIVEYSFTDPEAGMNVYTASQGGTQLQIEGGYQVSTKRIYFKKAPASNHSWSSHCQKSGQSSMCGRSIVRSGCSSKAYGAKTALQRKDTRTWMRIQPSLGVAYIPGAPRSDIYTKSVASQTVYTYNAGNWTTALLTGVSFEFGKAAQSTFNISLNYVKGLGMDTKSVTTVAGNKPALTTLKSEASSWNLRIGFPINLTKKQPVSKQQFIEKSYKPAHRCGHGRSR